ncbi:putative serine/threonine-protein kinase-like [Capsicum annuum]|nr:putative serine/threonine-protein kinase-like [Capsicum annuum]
MSRRQVRRCEMLDIVGTRHAKALHCFCVICYVLFTVIFFLYLALLHLSRGSFRNSFPTLYPTQIPLVAFHWNKMKTTVEETKRVGCETNHHGICAVCLNKILLQETALVKGETKLGMNICGQGGTSLRGGQDVGSETEMVQTWKRRRRLHMEADRCPSEEVCEVDNDRLKESVTCILRWATYKEEPTCPQCKHPFEFLYIHRSLDGRFSTVSILFAGVTYRFPIPINILCSAVPLDYMFEESVCLLLRASWFKPLTVEERAEIDDDDLDDLYMYDDAEEDFEEDYFVGSSSRLRIGNRRWGDNGYVSAGRQEARPVYRSNPQESGVGPSREPKKETAAPKELVGRRAKRALKREAADKVAAEKHQQRLVRMGRK